MATLENIYLPETQKIEVTVKSNVVGINEYVFSFAEFDDSGSITYQQLINPTLTLERGKIYRFNIRTEGYKFYIKEKKNYLGNYHTYNTGLFNNGAEEDFITFIVPIDAPDELYYQSDIDKNLNGIFKIIDGFNEFNVTSTSDNQYFSFTGGAGGYNVPIYLKRGNTYKFIVNLEGDKFVINRLSTIDADELYNDDEVIKNNNIESGTITIIPNKNTPDFLYYNSISHVSMKGTIYIIGSDELEDDENNLGGELQTNIIQSIDSSRPIHFNGNVKYDRLLTKESNGYTLRQVERFWERAYVDGVTTTWAQIYEWPSINGCLKNSKIRMETYLPARNDSTSWGGVYFQYSIRVRTSSGGFSDYRNLGNTGYVTVMNEGDQDIHTFKKPFWIDVQEYFPETIDSDFDFNLKIRSRSYDGTAYVGRTDQNDINAQDWAIGSRSNHFFSEVIYFEYASIRD